MGGSTNADESYDSKEELLQNLKSRPQMKIGYLDTLHFTLIKMFCCCKRDTHWYRAKKKRLEAHEEAYRRINNEIDLLNIITLMRQCQVLSFISLKEHQRHLIPYLHKYNVDPNTAKQSEENLAINGPYYQYD
mmetsp:Transcript_2025/g.2766  ORF Transcript_2025/g.2766 Transcript_2025/m.2766 type:complete len:133 (-) Transcript_2025:252-650(-)